MTDLVNTGIYVLSPRVLDFIPEDRPCDFGKELFPALLRRGERLAGVVLEGYWQDIGTPEDYYRCCADALDGKLRLTPGEGFTLPQRPEEPERSSAIRVLSQPALLSTPGFPTISPLCSKRPGTSTEGFGMWRSSPWAAISSYLFHSQE